MILQPHGQSVVLNIIEISTQFLKVCYVSVCVCPTLIGTLFLRMTFGELEDDSYQSDLGATRLAICFSFFIFQFSFE